MSNLSNVVYSGWAYDTLLNPNEPGWNDKEKKWRPAPNYSPGNAILAAGRWVGRNEAARDIAKGDNRFVRPELGTSYCALFAAMCYGFKNAPSNAIDWWFKIPPRYKLERGSKAPNDPNWDLSGSPETWKIPVGALIFWDNKRNNNIYGHVAILARGVKGPRIIGTSFSQKGIGVYNDPIPILIDKNQNGIDNFLGVSMPWFDNSCRIIPADDELYRADQFPRDESGEDPGWEKNGIDWPNKALKYPPLTSAAQWMWSYNAANMDDAFKDRFGGSSGGSSSGGSSSGGGTSSGSSSPGVKVNPKDYLKVKRTGYQGILFNPPVPHLIFHRPQSASEKSNGAGTNENYYPSNDWLDWNYEDESVTDGLTQYRKPKNMVWKNNGTWETGRMVRDYSFAQFSSASDQFIGPDEAGNRYGFRFLFNPNTYSEALEAPTTGDPLVAAREATVGSSGFNASAGVSLNLFLSRVDDLRILRSKDYQSYYPSGSDIKSHRDGIMQFGTMHDVEYLLRMCNGKPWDTWRGKTSDIGLLLPVMVQVKLGPRMFRGIIDRIGIDHQMFAVGMIPVITQLSLSISRTIDAGDSSIVQGGTTGNQEEKTPPPRTVGSDNTTPQSFGGGMLLDPRGGWSR